jgi:hypothetical protein
METKDFVRYWKPGQTYFGAGLLQGEQDARIFFWSSHQAYLLMELRKEINDGWKPITEVGPSAFKVRMYTKTTLRNIIGGTPSRDYYEPEEFRVVLIKDS